MPVTIKDIVDSAKREWVHWGESTWNLRTDETHIGHTDDEVAFATYVLTNYCAVGGGSPTLVEIKDDRYFWSAVGMSAIMSGAGFKKSEFPFAQSHSVFIRHFIKARRAGTQSAAFWGFRTGEDGGQPEVGDIVAYARGNNMTPAKAAALFDRTTPYESHSDVVVAKRAKEIDVIGANVLDSVTKKTLRLDAQGNIQDDKHFWFAVLKCRLS
ncbi:MAG TPA: DUF2272 domain-containing protein [Pyrinomonadaceae bacterium]|jgi:hypothetical protein